MRRLSCSSPLLSARGASVYSAGSRLVPLPAVSARWRPIDRQQYRLPAAVVAHYYYAPKNCLRNFTTNKPSHAEKIADILLSLETARTAPDPSSYAMVARKAESTASALHPESEDAIRIRASIANGWWERAQRLHEGDALQQVIECHKHQLALVPKHLLAHKGMGMALYELARREPSKNAEDKKRQMMLAHDYLKTALYAKQRDAEINKYMVLVTRELKMYVQAVDYCRKAIRKIPPYEFESATATRRLNPAVQWFHTQLVELKALSRASGQT